MTNNQRLWQTIQDHVPRRTWLSIRDLFDIVERHVELDYEDLEPGRSPGCQPRWKSNLRRILGAKLRGEEGIVHRRMA